MTRRVRHSCLGLIFLMISTTAGGCSWHHTRIKMSRSKAWAAARETLQFAAQDDDPGTRWMAIEALAHTVGAGAGQVFVRGLGDPEAAVRAAAAMAIGDVGYAPAKTAVKAMAEAKGTRFWESDRRTYCAIIYALYRLGDNTHTESLGKLLWDKENQVRANAALVMGKMGEPSATGPLKMLLNDEQDAMVQIQLIESLALLGDERARRLLEAYAKTRFVDEQVMAIQAMARAKCPRAVHVIRERLAAKHPPRVRVVAAGALGRLGQFDYRGYNLCIDSVRTPLAVLKSAFGTDRKNTEDHAKSLQQLAATALGWIGRDGAVDYLHPLLRHQEGGVRVAAAMSMLRLLPGQAEKMRQHKARKGRR